MDVSAVTESQFKSDFERKVLEYFSTQKLSAFGADLAALSSFFDQLWYQPVVGHLQEESQGLLLHQVGYLLLALGRLEEAVQPMQEALAKRVEGKFWSGAASDANNLSELFLIIGNIAQAVNYAGQSIEFADLSKDMIFQMVGRSTYGNTLHQAGQLLEAESFFREAEELQKQRQPEYPLLYSSTGFQYCDLLLSQKNIKKC